MSFAAMHHGPRPLILPNAWDAGSARILCAAGFAAVGTTSMGVSASAGFPDGTRMGLDALDQISTVLRDAGVMINVDLEDGHSADPEVVAARARLLDADGVNLEDSTDHSLVPIELMGDKIQALKSARPDMFLNARPDTFFLGSVAIDDFLARAHAYVAAGADGIFLHGTTDRLTIETVAREIPVPLNVLAHPVLNVEQLGECGVRRISTGSLGYRAAAKALLDTALAVSNDTERPQVIGYNEMQELLESPATPDG